MASDPLPAWPRSIQPAVGREAHEEAQVSDYKVKSIDELEAIHQGAVKLAAAELGIESFGMQVLDFPAGFPHYPEHDHTADGQEEVYVVLRGSAEFQIDGERTAVESGQLVRVGPAATRKLVPGPDGVRVLAIGCAGDRPYERPADFQLEVIG
jgi:mannose-6-phosphate isomerase-like protein (cupin superfamily)